MKSVESTGVEVTDQDIKKPGVFYEYPESIPEIIFPFVSDKRGVCYHCLNVLVKRLFPKLLLLYGYVYSYPTPHNEISQSYVQCNRTNGCAWIPASAGKTQEKGDPTGRPYSS